MAASVVAGAGSASVGASWSADAASFRRATAVTAPVSALSVSHRRTDLSAAVHFHWIGFRSRSPSAPVGGDRLLARPA